MYFDKIKAVVKTLQKGGYNIANLSKFNFNKINYEILPFVNN